MSTTEYINGIFTEKFNDEAFKYALAMTAIETIGDGALKISAKTDNYDKYFAVGEASYILNAFVFEKALKNNKLGITNAYWNAGTNITDCLIGMYLGETYTVYQFIGIGLITIGILMI
jgi:multidrug transporter EmrE-like cation transporter